MKLEWNDEKNALNIRNRGLDFAMMREFNWDSALCAQIQYVDEEEREMWIGLTLYTVIVTERDDAIRVISLRRPTRIERDNWNEEAGYG